MFFSAVSGVASAKLVANVQLLAVPTVVAKLIEFIDLLEKFIDLLEKRKSEAFR